MASKDFVDTAEYERMAEEARQKARERAAEDRAKAELAQCEARLSSLNIAALKTNAEIEAKLRAYWREAEEARKAAFAGIDMIEDATERADERQRETDAWQWLVAAHVDYFADPGDTEARARYMEALDDYTGKPLFGDGKPNDAHTPMPTYARFAELYMQQPITDEPVTNEHLFRSQRTAFDRFMKETQEKAIWDTYSNCVIPQAACPPPLAAPPLAAPAQHTHHFTELPAHAIGPGWGGGPSNAAGGMGGIVGGAGGRGGGTNEKALTVQTVKEAAEAMKRNTVMTASEERKVFEVYKPRPMHQIDWDADDLVEELMRRIESDGAVHKSSLYDVVRLITGRLGEEDDGTLG